MKCLTDNELENALKEKAFKERKLTVEVVELLEETDRRRLYLKKGFSSLLEYCVKELKYSESSAYRRISLMRVAREIPEVTKSVEAGDLNLVNVAQAQTYFKAESKTKTISANDKRELLTKLEHKSKREAEKIILELAPQNVPKESVRQITDDRTRLSIVLPEKVMSKLEKLKDLLSHKMPNATFAELIDEISELALKKLDPLRIATPPVEKVEGLAAKMRQIKAGRYISKKVKGAVWKKSGGQCCYRDENTGKRCESKKFLEIDHVIPFSRGGESSPENLQLLCDAHNRWKNDSFTLSE